MIRASVIVPARNARATLPRTLEHLAAQVAPFDYEVIVVDDGSNDGTPELVRALGDRVTLIEQRAAGPAAARNRGVEASRGSVLAFCDADCYPTEQWLAAGVAALEHADMVQGKVLAEPGVMIGPFDRSLWIDHEVGLWETANLFVTRSLFDRVGGFEDWLVPVLGKALAEDVWFGWRAKRAGARSTFCAAALLHHAVFPRGAREYIQERRRCRHFPEMTAKMPELRTAFLYRGLFLTPRTAAFDFALLGSIAALVLRIPWPLLATLPFARHVRQRARTHGRRAALVDLAADATCAWALARGSLSTGSPVL